MKPQLDAYFESAVQWQCELKQLRTLVLDAQLAENLKWGSPCYSFEGSHVVILGSLKGCCSISFFKGALLQDPQGILEKPGEQTQAVRLIRFTAVEDIVQLEPVLKAYIAEAIEVEKAGSKVAFKPTTDFEIPEELENVFISMPTLSVAFKALTPGRQRGYLLFFNAAKQSKTRTARIEKYTARILDGKGMNDCTCGRSQKMPGCDGSHKFAGLDR